MPTIRQFVSDIQASIRAVSQDAFVPPQFIYSEGKSIIAAFLKSDNDAKKKLTKLAYGWTEIPCINLEEIPVIQCAEIDVTLCDKMLKSTKKIPEIYTYTYGNIVKHVASVNFSYFFDPTTPRQWNSIQKRRYKDKNKYYYFIIDNYLYLPVPKGTDLPIEALRMEAYFVEKKAVEVFNNSKDCPSCPFEDCISTLDYELVIAPYLLNDVKKELLNRLFNTYLRLSSDEYPNMNNLDKTNIKDIQTYETP